MQITLNGNQKTTQDGMTVAHLLAWLELEPMRVAVEINEDIVPRKGFAGRVIHEGDRIEIVTLVGGG